MINRRQLLSLLPLSLLLGGSFRSRSVLAAQSAEDVVTQLFRLAQEGNWSKIIDALSADDQKRMRRSLEATEKLSDAASIGDAMDEVPLQPEPFGELRGLLDDLTRLVEAEEAKQAADEPPVEDNLVSAARSVIDAGGLPRSRVKSDRDFLVAYLGRFEPFLDQLRNTELVIIGSISATQQRVQVVYRLADVLSLRPSVMTLTYTDLGWCAAGGNQLPMIAMLAAADRTMPTLELRVLGELTEAGLTHFLCEAECSIQGDIFQPAFCCTWFTKDSAVAEMRAGGYQQLKERLQRDLTTAWAQAIEREQNY